MEFRLQAPTFGDWSPTEGDSVTTRSEPASAAGVVGDLRAADDAVLVEAFRAGRAEAFDIVVERHQRAIYYLCFRFAGNHEDAADLAQDAFVRAYRGLGQFKGTSSLGTWLHRIAVNTALNRRALKKPETDSLDGAELPDLRTPDPDDELDNARRLARVRAAVERLPPKQRATVILRVYHDLSYDEIARTLGTTVGAAKANIFHALGKLRRVLDP